MNLLSARGVTRRFGGHTAVDGVDVHVGPGEIVGLIGPNGAGKTTLFNCLSGFLVPDTGTIEMGGTDVTDLDVEQRARHGLGRTFQQLAVFPTMTVREHVLAAAEQAGRVLAGHDGRRRGRTARARERRRADAVLEQFALQRHADQAAGDLPTGVLRRVEVARAVAGGARMLLLDEPASGLDPREAAALAELAGSLRADGRGVLLVEHDVAFVTGLADRVVVMHLGRVIATGTPEEVLDDLQVRTAYLGEPEPA